HRACRRRCRTRLSPARRTRRLARAEQRTEQRHFCRGHAAQRATDAPIPLRSWVGRSYGTDEIATYGSRGVAAVECGPLAWAAAAAATSAATASACTPISRRRP